MSIENIYGNDIIILGIHYNTDKTQNDICGGKYEKSFAWK